MMKTVARNNFIDNCEKLLNSKPNKNGIRLQKISYVGHYKAEVMTITIERGDKLNKTELPTNANQNPLEAKKC